MLKSRWKKPACRKPAVSSRQYSSLAIAARERAPSVSSVLPPRPLPVKLPPPAVPPMYATTQIPIRM